MFDVFHRLPISHDLDDGKIRSRDVIVDTQVKFSTLLLEPPIHDGLAKCGYIYLSPIQQNALPLVLTGSSIIAHAKSGTGKTLIYVLPILNHFVERKLNHLHGIILAPTREIAKQIHDVFQNVACFVRGLQIEYFIGGTPLDMDVLKCMNCHLAIGAPGRIKHLIDLGYLRTTNLEFLVLDEVDALFDHKEYAVENIISTLPPPKQLIVCTATFSSQVGDFVKSVVPNVKYISADKLETEKIGNISNMLIAVKQYVAPVGKDSSSMGAMRKREKLVEILKKFNFEQCFVFVNYMTLVRSICNHLISQDFSASWICSDQSQSSRINTINKLKMNHYKILVTTDLAARGIDVHKVNLVINLGLPFPPEIYIHRMGRAGRYGSEGAVITILDEGEEMTTFTKMISVISTDPIDLLVLPEQIDATMSNLVKIQCLPTEGSISVDEFSFKRQMKDNQEKTNVKIPNKKAKKKKKRKSSNASKLVLQNSIITNGLSSVSKNDAVMANDEDNPVSDRAANECIEQFCQSLAEFSIAGELTPAWNSLENFFGLDNGPATTDECSTFVHDPPANLLSYAIHVKQRNEFIDAQIVPCGTDEFLSLLNRSDGTFVRHSSGLCGLIKEISGKIERPAKQQLTIGRTVTLSHLNSTDSDQSEISRQVSSVGGTSLSQQLLETMIVDGDEKNIPESTIRKNASSWSKQFLGGFNLAEEFSNAMLNYGKEKNSSSSNKSTRFDVFEPFPSSDSVNTMRQFEISTPKQNFNNHQRRLNSDVENEKNPKETDSNEKQLKRTCNEIELSYPVTANVCSQSRCREHEISLNHKSSNPSHQPSENVTQLHKSANVSTIQKDVAECSCLSDEFSYAINNSIVENDPRNSSKITRISSTDFSTSLNHSNSISTSDQFLGAFESKEGFEIISNVPDFSNQCSADVGRSSGNILPATIPRIEEVSDCSFDLVPTLESRSNSRSFPDLKKCAKSSSHLILRVPENENERKSNISVALATNDTSNSCTANLNCLYSSNIEANEESSLTISYFKQKSNLNFEVPSNLESNRVEFSNYCSEYLSEYSTTHIPSATHESKNRLAGRFTSVQNSKRDKNVRQSENFKTSNNAAPILCNYVTPSSKALNIDFENRRDKADGLNLLRGDQITANLPPLRSHVSSQQEQKIWQHHFAFIRRHSISRGRITASQ